MVVFLQVPGNDAGAQSEAVASNGVTGVLAVCIVRVAETQQDRWHQATKDQAEGTCALQVM